jgi:hypothetical protein
MDRSFVTTYSLDKDMTSSLLRLLQPLWFDEVERILIPPFPGSNPGTPASQCGLCGVISRCGRTADIPEG